MFACIVVFYLLVVCMGTATGFTRARRLRTVYQNA